MRHLPCPVCKKPIEVTDSAPSLPAICPFCFRATAPAALDFSVLDQVLADPSFAAPPAVPFLAVAPLLRDPNRAAALNRQGTAAVSRGAYDEAIALFGEALRADPALPAAFNNRGYAYAAQKQYQ